MSNSISSPPYPGLATTTRGLYRDLIALREWLVEEQEQIKYLVKSQYADKLVEPDNIANEAVWESVGVIDKYVVLTRMRQLREGWDVVLREHEDSWDSQLCRRRRYDLFMLAHYIIRNAFMNPEAHEFREQRQYRTYLRKQKLLQQKLNDVLHLDELDTPTGDEDEENEGGSGPSDDDWFSDG